MEGETCGSLFIALPTSPTTTTTSALGAAVVADGDRALAHLQSTKQCDGTSVVLKCPFDNIAIELSRPPN